MLGNHHANHHRAGAGRARSGRAQGPPQRMAGQQERNDEHDARRTTTGHPAVARIDRAKRTLPAATDETTRLAGRWVLASGPDERHASSSAGRWLTSARTPCTVAQGPNDRRRAVHTGARHGVQGALHDAQAR
jgi:hypothetical protein